MAQIIREIRVDVSQPNVFQAIVAKQLDCNSRFLKITLVDFGVKIEVPNTAKVTINANRPDGKSQSFVGGANDDGTITVPLAKWMLEVAGELKCDVSVINTTDNKRLTSTDFFVNVQEAANKSTDISENPDGEIRVITPTQKIDENSSDDEYPSARAVYDLDNITATATGSAITIDSAKAPLQNLKLYGKTTQNGTPTPDAPVPLVSVGDSGSFEVGVYCGKNLLENLATTKTVNGITFTINADKSITINGTASATTMFDVNTTIKLDGNYILSGCPSEVSQQGVEWLFYDGAWQRDMGSGKTFTTSKAKTQKCVINIPSGKTITNATIYPMIRLATETDATYEPCNKQTLTMPFDLPSMPNTETKNEVDFGKGVHNKKVVSYTFDGSENWTLATSGTRRFVINNGIYAKRGIGVSSHFTQAVDTDLCFWVSGASGAFTIYDKNSKWADVNALKTWLSENKPTFLLELETPTETPLTETELNAYRHLMTNKGATTILSECEDTEVTYYISKPNAQAIGNIHSQVNKDYFKLQQAIISTGGSTL